jgi:hypothetical protein
LYPLDEIEIIITLNNSGLNDWVHRPLSANKAENQQIAAQTPNFTPKNVKLGVCVCNTYS